MATNTNTNTNTNTFIALRGLFRASSDITRAASRFGINPRYVLTQLTDAGIEIERLNSETIRLRKRIKFLDEFYSSSELKWDSLIFAIMGTDAGKDVCQEGRNKTTALAIQAINKTEAERKEALRTAEAFQEVASHSQAVKTHQLKILPEYFQAVIEGKKKAELRTNDRDFKVGDYLLLAEWDEEAFEYSGRKIIVEISDVTQCDFTAPKLVMLSFFDPCDEIPF
ncbi:putative exported phage-related protein [Yersinia pekkanenii]|uniref:Putative exported phage-related protein n=1 Tax=Yersinia pekkanenii TaxID=1288385 RepID=A0A0T9QHI5_9GAMM|nr:DUF3850 domain-containing protein [Yersinia pekkanenii]CNI11993.1 putative exported phage-related protein [Yersinia pekkanenii]